MVQDAERKHDVEPTFAEPGASQIGLHEERSFHAESAGRVRRLGERGARQVGADHPAPPVGEKDRHLSGPAAEIEDVGVLGDRLVEQARQGAPLAPQAQALQGVARAVAGEGRLAVEAPHLVGPPILHRQKMA